MKILLILVALCGLAHSARFVFPQKSKKHCEWKKKEIAVGKVIKPLDECVELVCAAKQLVAHTCPSAIYYVDGKELPLVEEKGVPYPECCPKPAEDKKSPKNKKSLKKKKSKSRSAGKKKSQKKKSQKKKSG